MVIIDMEGQEGIDEMLGEAVQTAKRESKDTLTVRLSHQAIKKAVITEECEAKIAHSIIKLQEIAVNALQPEAQKGIQALQTAVDSSIQDAATIGKKLQDENEAIKQRLEILLTTQEAVRTDCESEQKMVLETQQRVACYATQMEQKKAAFETNCARASIAPLYIDNCEFDGVVTRLLVINFKKGSLSDVHLKIVGDGKEEVYLPIGMVRSGAQEIRVEEWVPLYDSVESVAYTLVGVNSEVLSNIFVQTWAADQAMEPDPQRELAKRLRSHFTVQSEEQIYQWLQANPNLTYEYITATYPRT